MRAEVLAVGTELLIGQIANVNAQEMSQVLSEIGVDVLFHTVVGDNEERIAESIETALGRADVLIITGGLGPTHDDLTREAISRATGRALQRRPELESNLRALFKRLGREMPDMNLRQADQPEGAEPIENPKGTAPGVSMLFNGKRIYAVPGVPSEMRMMMTEHVIPDLARVAGGQTLVSRIIKVAGFAESEVGAKLASVIEDLNEDSPVTLALLSGAGEIRVRLTAKAPDRAAASSLIEPVERRVIEVLGSGVFGTDDETLEGVVAKMLAERRLTLAVAESLTGGLLSSRLVAVPGTSQFLVAGYVTYSVESKVRDIGVPQEVIDEHGAVSEETAKAMAEGARTRAGTDIGLSTTGEAGPEPAEASVGTVCIGLAWEGGSTVRTFQSPAGDRELVRLRAARAALNLLRLWLIGEID